MRERALVSSAPSRICGVGRKPHATNTWVGALESKTIRFALLLKAFPPWLCEVQSFKTLDTSDAQSRARVIARRKRAVRGEHQGRALRGQGAMGEKETFFGAFLAFTKKVPAGRRTAEALALLDDIKSKVPGCPLSRGMTSRSEKVA